MLQKITFDLVDNSRKVLGLEWDSECQRVIMEELCKYDEICLQGYRQVGKSWNCGLLGGTYSFAGGIPIIAAPTLNQASLIIFSDIRKHAENLIDFFDLKFKKDPDRANYIMWAHGGGLLALSTANISETGTKKKPSEGWHGNLLIIDEAHRVAPEFAGIFIPMLKRATIEGNAKVILLGVGGHKSSAIETMKQRGYHQVRMPASRAVEIQPELKEYFDQVRHNYSDWEWRMMYECEEVTEGLRVMFPFVPEGIDVKQFKERNFEAEYKFGIDVGKVRDETVVKVLERYGDVVNEVDDFAINGIDYMTIAEMVYQFINKYPWKSRNIAIETNGPGEVLRDILNQYQYFGQGGSIQSITTTAGMKKMAWHSMLVEMREGRFGVQKSEARLHYEKLLYNVNMKGEIEFEHSDNWMALVMAWQSMQRVGAF